MFIKKSLFEVADLYADGQTEIQKGNVTNMNYTHACSIYM